MRFALLTKAYALACASTVAAAADTQEPLSSSDSPFTKDADKFIQDTMQTWHLPGVAIAVIDGNQTFYKSYGYSKLPDTRITRDTLWHGGSTTKAFLSATWANIIANKTYPSLTKGWKTPLSSLDPANLVLSDAWANNHVTLEDAASHRTGLASHDFSFLSSNDSRTPKDIVRTLRHLSFEYEPRDVWHYCNLMYVTLTHALEALTNKNWWDVVGETLLSPLGITTAFADLNKADASGMPVALGYFWDEGGQKYVQLPRMNMANAFGAGAIVATVDDYVKWVRYLLSEATPKPGTALAEMRSVRIPVPALMLNSIAIGYALGWEHGTIQGKRAWFHGGTTMAHSAEVYWVPELDWGFVSFTNTAKGNLPMESIAFRLIEDKVKAAAKDWHTPPKPVIPPSSDPADVWYPNRPKTPLPPPVALDMLAASYHDDGYGSIKVEVAANNTLTAVPVGMLHSFELSHVSGDYWLAAVRWPEMSPNVLGVLAAQFVVGSDGKGSEVVITQTPEGVDGDPPVHFKRVSA